MNVGIMSVVCQYYVGFMSVYGTIEFIYPIKNEIFTNSTMSDVSNIESKSKIICSKTVRC